MNSFPGKGVENIMTDDVTVKAGNAVDNGLMAAYPVRGEVLTGDHKPVSDDVKAAPVAPHNMDSEVTTSIFQVKLRCPDCGKSTLRAEFPDQYEAWTKCSSCGFFMGMSNDDWHRMENSHNINEKIKRMAIKQELLKP